MSVVLPKIATSLTSQALRRRAIAVMNGAASSVELRKEIEKAERVK